MEYPKAVRRENDLIRQELGSEHGHARYQWAWSGEMEMPMVVVDPETGELEYDYICGCGVNRNVHDPSCNSLTVVQPKWEVRNVVPTLHNQWVFARWVAPEMSRDRWERVFNIPYPEGGYLVPVGDLMQCLALRAGEIPSRDTTLTLIGAVREHFSVSARQRAIDTKNGWDRRHEAKREELLLKFKDIAPVHMGFPGEKNDWSAGGDPGVESPALRKETVQ